MTKKEAHARIKINKLLEQSGWRFFDEAAGKANIRLEPKVRLEKNHVDQLGDNFENVKNGFIDYLLLDERNFPLIVLEAKPEHKHPLVGKEQARNYAKSLNCRFTILSNGNLHYLWDLEQGNPQVIVRFPDPSSLKFRTQYKPNPERLINEQVAEDYIALTQIPRYIEDPSWTKETERQTYVEKNRLRFLRKYQLQAVHAIQHAVKNGKNRFLLEMATGTGKTLTAAAVIKLFLRTENASRILFLVDRLELEDQAQKAFNALLKNDYTSVIYKESRDDWRKAHIVVTTIQALMFNNKFKDVFSPTDFDLIISDESHRSINGNRRPVFEYFTGYKLGLTATPKDYLKKLNESDRKTRDPREIEARELLDTYRTFGCDSGHPTFRYSLLDGVRDGFLINPFVVDARTDITTQLLSEKGYSALEISENEEDNDQIYFQKDFEKKFFSEPTNRLLCETFIKNALRDPITNEIGKTIVFAISQNHAAKLTQILNELTNTLFPKKYNSDFAIQVTSHIPDAKKYTINFSNNNLMGSGNFLESYKTSKARVCVTVGMMTTGYDCPDLLNLCFMRPIFSPTDFIQLKGRGTRTHNFLNELFDLHLKKTIHSAEKQRFKLFDFFANCEYFEDEFDYDEEIPFPPPNSGTKGPIVPPPQPPAEIYENFDPDSLSTLKEEQIGLQGMRIDRMFFKQFEDEIKQDQILRDHVTAERWDLAVGYVKEHLLNKPSEFYTLDKLQKAADVDRHLSLREILEKIFGHISHFKSKNDLLEEEFEKFLLNVLSVTDESLEILKLKYFFKAYASDNDLRNIIDRGALTELCVNPSFGVADYKGIPEKWRTKIPEYIKSNVPFKQLSL